MSASHSIVRNDGDHQLKMLSEVVKRHPFFAGLEDSEIDILLSIIPVDQVPRGTNLFYAGDAADSVYFLFEGIVKKTFISLGGDEKIISVSMAGDIFGELFLGKYRHRIATASVIEHALLGCVNEALLYELIAAYPPLAKNLIAHLADEQRETLARIHALMHINARHRLLGVLLSFARRLTGDENGWVMLPRSITQDDLANIACMNRATVSKHVNDLRRAGVLGGSRHEILVNCRQVEQMLNEIGLEILI